MTDSFHAVQTLDSLSLRNNSFLSSIHPLVQFGSVLIFVTVVVSFNRYSISGLLPFFLFPVSLMVLGEVPVSLLLKRFKLVFPLLLLMGCLNPVLDSRLVPFLPGLNLRAGWFSLFSLLLKGSLTVSSGLLLLTGTGIEGIVRALRILKVPHLFSELLQFTYRYIHVLMNESARIVRAYQLRAPERKGVSLSHWGALGGQWFIRTYQRSLRIHNAMTCRGYSRYIPTGRTQKLSLKDGLYFFLWCFWFILCRTINIPAVLGQWTAGGLHV